MKNPSRRPVFSPQVNPWDDGDGNRL